MRDQREKIRPIEAFRVFSILLFNGTNILSSSLCTSKILIFRAIEKKKYYEKNIIKNIVTGVTGSLLFSF